MYYHILDIFNRLILSESEFWLREVNFWDLLEQNSVKQARSKCVA